MEQRDDSDDLVEKGGASPDAHDASAGLNPDGRIKGQGFGRFGWRFLLLPDLTTGNLELEPVGAAGTYDCPALPERFRQATNDVEFALRSVFGSLPTCSWPKRKMPLAIGSGQYPAAPVG